MKKLLTAVILSTIALTGCDNKVTYDCGDEKFVLKGGRLISNGYVIEHEFDNTYKLDTWAGKIRYTLLDNGIDVQFGGMKKFKEYADPKNTISYAYAITRKDWERIRMEEPGL